MIIKKIISGGQTGVDQAAWDAAIEMNISFGGWVPRGFENERKNIGIEKIYRNLGKLEETVTSNVDERTELNVQHSDGTLIITNGNPISGTEKTLEFAKKYAKPYLHIDLKVTNLPLVTNEIISWVKRNNIKNLNVAGSKESEDPTIYDETLHILKSLIISLNKITGQ